MDPHCFEACEKVHETVEAVVSRIGGAHGSCVKEEACCFGGIQYCLTKEMDAVAEFVANYSSSMEAERLVVSATSVAMTSLVGGV